MVAAATADDAKVSRALYRVGLISDEEKDEILDVVTLRERIATFQAIHGLPVDGEAGPITTRKLLQPRFCAVADRMIENASQRARWNKTKWTGTDWGGATPSNMRLTYSVSAAIPQWTMDQTRTAWATALQLLTNDCAISFEWVNDPGVADIRYDIGKIDQVGATLAWCELPIGPDRQLKSMIDQIEPWRNAVAPPQGFMDLVRVVAHETGHGVGLEHGPEGCLMAPYYNPQIRGPQAWDVKELQDRYGKRVIETPTTPTPTPTDPGTGNGMMPIKIDIRGFKYEGQVKRVA